MFVMSSCMNINQVSMYLHQLLEFIFWAIVMHAYLYLSFP